MIAESAPDGGVLVDDEVELATEPPERKGPLTIGLNADPRDWSLFSSRVSQWLASDEALHSLPERRRKLARHYDGCESLAGQLSRHLRWGRGHRQKWETDTAQKQRPSAHAPSA